MTIDELNDAMQRDIQLHEQVEVMYVVDGWLVNYSTDDGENWTSYWGETPLEALTTCFSQIRNLKGRR